ncbi:MAG: hypothetical protein KAW46_05390 [candidate division Zixibacteria bacterium]|nr:hypothetical protein [candidate division Zixibacteria bacterium]
MFVLRVIVAGIVVMGLCAQTSAEQPFFQSVSGPQPISMDTSKVLVKFDPDVLPETEDDILNSIGRVVARLESDLTIDGFVVCSLSTGVGYSTFLDSLDSVDGLYLVEPFYLDWNDMPLLFGETFCLDFDDSMSAGAIDSIALSFNVSSVTQSDCMSNIYFLKNNDTTGYRVLELANMFYALGETQLSHPDCKVRLSLEAYQLYDEYESYQRYLKKVVGWFGDSTVWDFSGLARPVTVAILDDGVEEHEDLPADRILPGHDFAEGDDDPSPDMHAHGMAMTGVIGASHTTLGWWEGGPLDSTGIISLNPHVDILPVKIAYDDSATI